MKTSLRRVLECLIPCCKSTSIHVLAGIRQSNGSTDSTQMTHRILFTGLGFALILSAARADQPAGATPRGRQLLHDFVAAQVSEIESQCLADIRSLHDWQ